MSGEFYSRKDSHSTKFKWKSIILVKLSFRELCDSRLSALHPFDNMVISWVKNKSKIERWAVSSGDTNLWMHFCDPHWQLICRNKWHPGTSEISTLPEIAVWTQFICCSGMELGDWGSRITNHFFIRCESNPILLPLFHEPYITHMFQKRIIRFLN